MKLSPQALVMVAGTTMMVGGCAKGATADYDSRKVGPGPQLEVVASPARTAWRGFPCVVELNLRNDSQPISEVEFKSIPAGAKQTLAGKQLILQSCLPKFDFVRGQFIPVNVTIHGPGEKAIRQPKRADPMGYWELHHPREAEPARPMPRAALPRGEWRGFVFDLGPWIWELEPGRYRMSARVYPWEDADDCWESKSFEIEVKELPHSIQIELKQKGILTDVPGDGYPGKRWIGKEANYADLKRMLPSEAAQELALHRFLATVRQARDLTKADLSILDDAPKRLDATAAWLKYEVAHARGDAKRMNEIRTRITNEHKEVLWRLDDADSGQGMLARFLQTGFVR